jgi:hypothetical protein
MRFIPILALVTVGIWACAPAPAPCAEGPLPRIQATIIAAVADGAKFSVYDAASDLLGGTARPALVVHGEDVTIDGDTLVMAWRPGYGGTGKALLPLSAVAAVVVLYGDPAATGTPKIVELALALK